MTNSYPNTSKCKLQIDSAYFPTWKDPSLKSNLWIAVFLTTYPLLAAYVIIAKPMERFPFTCPRQESYLIHKMSLKTPHLPLSWSLDHVFSLGSWIFNSRKILHATKLGYLSVCPEAQVCVGPWLNVTHCKKTLLTYFSLKFMQKKIISLQIVHTGFNIKFLFYSFWSFKQNSYC